MDRIQRLQKSRRYTINMNQDLHLNDTNNDDTHWEMLLNDPRGLSVLEQLAEEAHQEYLRGETQDLDEFLGQAD